MVAEVSDQEPFLFPGSTTGCLLIHGFGGSPLETRGLGTDLARRGYTVQGVRLAGHGAAAKAFCASRWPEWLASTEQGFDELSAVCERVVVVGFSLGGVLGLLLSQRRQLDGLVTMGSRVIPVGGWRQRWSPLLRLALAWRTPSLAPVDELRKVVREAGGVLPKVRLPLLVMQGRDDVVVLPRNAEAIMSGVASAEKELVWWDQTGHHMLVEGPHRQAIFERVAAFVADVERRSAVPAIVRPG